MMGIITTALAYALFAETLTITPVATAVTLTLGEPLTATLLGVLVLRESLNGVVELKNRRTGEREELSTESALTRLTS